MHPDLKLAGYFPKRVLPRTEWLQAPQVVDICSASTCVSPGPDDWIVAWKHNEFGLYASPALALSVVPTGAQGFQLFAYALWPWQFAEKKRLPLEPPEGIEPLGPGFESLGFDAVSRCGGSFFECSPLSCNGGAKEFATNAHCLFVTLEEAIAGAEQFSTGNWEPGPYAVVEVLRRTEPEAGQP